MKKLKKALLALLAISVMLCGFGIFAFAADDAEKAASDILEFYETKVYVNETYDGITEYGDAYADADEAFSAGSFDEAVIDGGVLRSKNLQVSHSSVMFDGSVPAGFGLNTAIRFNDSQVIGGFSIALRNAAFGDVNASKPLRLFVKDANGFKIASGTEVVEYDDDIENDLLVPVDNIDDNVMYDVMVYCTVRSGVVSGSVLVTAGGATVASGEFSVSGYSPLGITATYAPAGSGYNQIETDYLEIYEGSFARRLNGNEDATGALIKKISESNDKQILSVAKKVIFDYGYATDDADVQDAIDLIVSKLADDFATEFKNAVNDFNSDDTYPNRYADLKNAEFYYTLIFSIRDNYPETWEQINVNGLLADKIEAFVIEKEALATIEAKAQTFVAAVEADSLVSIDAATYAALKNAVQTFEANAFDTTYSSVDYPASRISAALAKAALVETAYESRVERAGVFAEKVKAAYNLLKADIDGENTISKADFAAGYAAYIVAYANESAVDSTYEPDSELWSSVDDLLDTYAECKEYVSAIDAAFLEFYTALNDADESDSFTVKIAREAIARPHKEKFESLYIAYPGAEDAIERYEALVELIAAQEIKAKEYIDAVLEIFGATNLTERKELVEAALEIAATGADDSTFDAFKEPIIFEGKQITVSDAKTYLSEFESAIKNGEQVVANFKNYVANISKAKTAEDRISAIKVAIGYKSTAYGIDNDYNPDPDGIDEAADKLDDEIVKYNSDIKNSNEALEDAYSFASDVICAATKGDTVKEMVAIIKKIYD